MIRKNKHFLISLPFLIFGVATISIWLIISNLQSSSTNKHLTLQETFAYAYYSTSLPSEWLGDGESYLIMIDRNGRFRLVNSSGLELNSIIQSQEELLLHKKNSLLRIRNNEGTEEIPLDRCSVHTGYAQASGHLADVHYSVFNQNMDGDRYVSTIRWGDSRNIYCEDINEFVYSVGDDGSNLYLLTTDIKQLQGLNLVKIEFEEDGSIQKLVTPISNMKTDNVSPITNLVWHHNKLFAIFDSSHDTHIQLNMLEIDLNLLDLKIHEIKTYDLNVDPMHFFFNRNSMTSLNGMLYFVDGFGQVHNFDPDTGRVSYLFSLSDYERKNYLQDEMVYFSKDRLYFYFFDETLGTHVIDTYSLDGAKEDRIEIPWIREALQDKQHVIRYDFGIIE